MASCAAFDVRAVESGLMRFFKVDRSEAGRGQQARGRRAIAERERRVRLQAGIASGANACWMAVDHSFRSRSCHTISTRRAVGAHRAGDIGEGGDGDWQRTSWSRRSG